MWLLDTVALSESWKARANPGFTTWLDGVEHGDLHTSVLCLGELRRGVVTLASGDKRAWLEQWLQVELRGWLGGGVFLIDEPVAAAWGRLGIRGKAEPVDALIGCTAAVHGLTVITRNARHFEGLGAPVLNPWT